LWFEIRPNLLICMNFNMLYFNVLKVLPSFGDRILVVQYRMPWPILANSLRTVNFTIGENIKTQFSKQTLHFIESGNIIHIVVQKNCDINLWIRNPINDIKSKRLNYCSNRNIYIYIYIYNNSLAELFGC
jgi:hypothetical protein